MNSPVRTHSRNQHCIYKIEQQGIVTPIDTVLTAATRIHPHVTVWCVNTHLQSYSYEYNHMGWPPLLLYINIILLIHTICPAGQHLQHCRSCPGVILQCSLCNSPLLQCRSCDTVASNPGVCTKCSCYVDVSLSNYSLVQEMERSKLGRLKKFFSSSMWSRKSSPHSNFSSVSSGRELELPPGIRYKKLA